MLDEKMKEIRQASFGTYSAFNYFIDYKDQVVECPNCEYSKEDHYYSLYFVEIHSDYFEDRFGFHIPYPLGWPFLPSLDTLERIDHNEGEGIFRFGRPLTLEEGVIYPEKRVLKAFNTCIGHVKVLNSGES